MESGLETNGKYLENKLKISDTEPGTDLLSPYKKEIENVVLENPRSGNALKLDKHHNFNDIIDNYAGKAEVFDIPTKDSTGKIVRTSQLMQIEGSYNKKQGIFEWIIDQNRVTHRRFIPNGKITGFPNQKG